MLLEGKTAVIYGGAGAIGSAVARAFAREGATVFLAGRTEGRLEELAREIRASGGNVGTATVDALDEEAVDAHAAAIVAQTGHLDISFNLISHNDVQGTPLVEMEYADFERPVVTALKTTFLTSRAAARHMIEQGSGVILMFGGYGDPARDFSLGGLQVAFQALDALRNQLATELGSYGIRVATLQTGGVTETLPPDFRRSRADRRVDRGRDVAEPCRDVRRCRQRRRLRSIRLGAHHHRDRDQHHRRFRDRLRTRSRNSRRRARPRCFAIDRIHGPGAHDGHCRRTRRTARRGPPPRS